MESSISLAIYRSIFISDIHLGTKDCKADYLYHCLSQLRCDTLFLVGDIVDLWALRRKAYWPESHHKLFNKFVELAQSGTRVVYIPGNHDEAIRDYLHLNIAQVELFEEYHHLTNANKRLLVIHGDVFDSAVRAAPLLTWTGDCLYDFLLFLNRCYSRLRKLFGRPYWSLSTFIKSKVSKAQEYISRYRCAALKCAKNKGFDGVVCGHIHQPDLCETEQGIYANCGDWIENCTLLVEHLNGDMELVRWTEVQQAISQYRTQVSSMDDLNEAA
ncbi:UDP-2,3-diacylglucosamine diphosphatase [Pleionea sp. CnH1-48]|uniref:UDP-2,3-diacylglucosamine diphosphatase n=1 Tax=Pleionea sp. CnH1-48 TaxID=2954494 RepID=UPI00209760BF|nr:UDP-2,3-diacylglucosamine diphosphatase [Pleionea sp. CnH1-48]MCO7225656.1 UDP-2,3-diacylglucosamine diphosphatase [Pleionea sp. CnH1-48]